jgi:oxygen-independent coproporphyrinogen-3 oxidase
MDRHAPGLYLHLPFCSAICPYCDFAVLTGDGARKRRFVASLVREMELWAEGAAAFAGIDTIYFGGGTPSAHPPEEIAAILEAARRLLPIAARPRVCFEANPEDVTPESARSWRDLGIEFLSLGIQSFDPAALAFLGRRHSADEARRSVEIVRDASLPLVSIDLIYGLPGQSLEGWRSTLETAVALAPDHLSCYQLTFHEGTPFGFRLARGTMAEMPEEGQAEMFGLTHRFLADAGYPGYEVSSFARSPAHRSPHNPKYWDHTPYLGLGPSAHSFDGRRRWWNERKLGPWEKRVAAGEWPIEGSEELTPADLALEALMLGLRTVEGIDLERFRSRFGYDLLKRNEPLVERLAGEKLLVVSESALVPTLPGWAVADSLARAFDLGPA